MRPQIAHVLAALHSRSWRARYGSEFEALLADIPASAPVIVDCAISIIASRRRVVFAGLITLAFVAASMLFGYYSSTKGVPTVAFVRHVSASLAPCTLSAPGARKPKTLCRSS